MIDKDTDLIIAFAMREANDYNPPKDEEWTVQVVRNIIYKIPDNLGQLKLISIGNTGIPLRELTFYGSGETKCHLLIDTDGDGTVNRIA